MWLKDTSTNGTLLNDVLVHDTARPIQHNDVMTIAGRKFRFEAESVILPSPNLSSSLYANVNMFSSCTWFKDTYEIFIVIIAVF